MSRRQRREAARALYRFNQELRRAIQQGAELHPTAASSPAVTVSSNNYMSHANRWDVPVYTSDHLYAQTAEPAPSNSRTDDAARRADEASRRERERMNQEPVTIEARMPDAWEDWAMRSRVQFVGGASRPDCTKARRDPRKARDKRKAQAQARKQARKRR